MAVKKPSVEEVRQKPLKILLVEDNHGDVALAKSFFRTFKFPFDLEVIMTGAKAEEALWSRRPNPFEKPDLILLDLYLPQKDGREILAWVKQDSHLKDIPVIAVSSSREVEDVRAVYQMKADYYIIKPIDEEQFKVVEQYLEQLWARKNGPADYFYRPPQQSQLF